MSRKQKNKVPWWGWLLPAASLLIAVIAYPGLPKMIPTHWGISGAADHFSPKETLFFLPLMTAAIMAAFRILPKMDPRNYPDRFFKRSVRWVEYAVGGIFLLLEGYTIAWCHGVRHSVQLILMLGVGALFMIIGNVMPKFRSNWFFGIRTPWALSNEENWLQTQRVGGRCFFLVGLLFLGTAFLQAVTAAVVVIVATIVCAAVPVVYSYCFYRRSQMNGVSK